MHGLGSALRAWTLPLAATAWGCATTPGAKPDDMSAEQHEATASEHRQAASGHAAQYDENAEAQGVSPYIDEYGTVSTFDYNPTAEHLRHAKKHRQHAADHEAAAKALEAFEEQECGRFAPEVRELCPLMGKVVSFEDIGDASASERGVRIRFAADVDRDAVVAHMRCHLAFARKMGREGMDHCPLYIEGVTIGDGEGATDGTVELRVEDEALLKELRRRVRAHVPQGD